MHLRTEAQPATTASTDHLPDVRTYWRVVLAVLAPLPMLVKGVFYLLSPIDGDAGFGDSVAAFRDHPGLLGLLTALGAVFVVGLLPATLAVVLAARRGAPRPTAAGASVASWGS